MSSKKCTGHLSFPRILDRHKGSIKVKAEVGKGSTFCVTLPACREAAVGE